MKTGIRDTTKLILFVILQFFARRVSPEEGAAGSSLTISGANFLAGAGVSSSFEVSVGPNVCDVSSVAATEIICGLRASATAGNFRVGVVKDREGAAIVSEENEQDASLFTVIMRIDTVSPTHISLHGGTSLTIAGAGFAKFGLMNQVTLRNGPRGLNVSCVPRVMKNYECWLTKNDPGLQCGEEFGFGEVAFFEEKISIRAYSNWIDFSGPQVIECDLDR